MLSNNVFKKGHNLLDNPFGTGRWMSTLLEDSDKSIITECFGIYSLLKVIIRKKRMTLVLHISNTERYK